MPDIQTQLEPEKTVETPSAPTILQQAVAPETPEVEPVDGEVKPADGEVKPEENKKVEPPAEYKFELPEGFEISDERKNEFTKFAQAKGLSQEEAQGLVKQHVDAIQDAVKKVKDAEAQQWNDLRTKWVQELQSDPEFGGEKLNATKEQAAKAVRKYGGPALNLLFETGWGDNAELVRTFARIGRDLGEDTLVEGKPNPNKPSSAAEILFGKS